MGFIQAVMNFLGISKTDEVSSRHPSSHIGHQDVKMTKNDGLLSNDGGQDRDNIRMSSTDFSLSGLQKPQEKKSTDNKPKTKVYVVQSGDWLSKIASKHGTTVKELLKLNPQITNPDRINVGQKINIPVQDDVKAPEKTETVKETKKATTQKTTKDNHFDLGDKYDKKAAQQLVNAAKNVKYENGYCAKFVRQVLGKSGLVDGESVRVPSAYQLLENNVYDKQPNLQKVDVPRDQLKNLPAGCIIVFGRGTAGGKQTIQSIVKHGHVLITDGKGGELGRDRQIVAHPNDYAVYVPKMPK